MRPILHSVPAAKMGQAPAESCTKCMKHTQTKGHDSEKLLSDKRKSTQQWCNHLMEWKMVYLFGVISQPSLSS